jgi:hypothetical protein
MEFPPLSRGARDALDRARQAARARGVEDPEGVDVLVALLDSEAATRMLELFDDQPAKLGAALQLMTRGSVMQADGDAEQRIVDLARAEAGRFGHQETGADHLLLALVRESGSVGGGLLWSLGITIDTGRRALRFLHGQEDTWEPPTELDIPSGLTTWGPMDAVPMGDVPEWIRERAEQIDEAMSSVEIGLERLRRVIAIGQSAEASSIVAELIVLEVRDSGAVLLWRTTSEDERLIGPPQLAITDDIGTDYTVFPMGWGGSGRESRGEILVTPAPPDAARTLVIEVRSFEDAGWMTAPSPGPLPPEVVLGLWRFEVPL